MESATELAPGFLPGEKSGGIAGVLLYLGKVRAASFQVGLSESDGHVKRAGGGLEGGQISQDDASNNGLRGVAEAVGAQGWHDEVRYLQIFRESENAGNDVYGAGPYDAVAAMRGECSVMPLLLSLMLRLITCCDGPSALLCHGGAGRTGELWKE